MHSIIYLPWPPTVNSLFGQRQGRQRYMSSRYKAWTAASLEAVKRQQIAEYYDIPVSVTYEFGAPDKRIRDLSNYLKAPEDLLVKAGVLKDDSLIHRGLFYWCPEVKKGVRIIIHPMPDCFASPCMWTETPED